MDCYASVLLYSYRMPSMYACSDAHVCWGHFTGKGLCIKACWGDENDKVKLKGSKVS